jgi:RNA polymerase sigma factor (sigma-70 family)
MDTCLTNTFYQKKIFSLAFQPFCIYHYTLVIHKQKNIMPQYSQDELVQGCLANDRRIQREVYDKYKDAMYTICYRILGNQELALEALQDGFVQVFKSIHSFKAQSTIGAWIKTIIARTAYKHIEKNKLHYLEDITPLSPIVWPNRVSGIDLENAMAQLPRGAKMVFILAEIEGYTHKEIADMMEISEGTSKSQLHAAKQKLQQYLSA